MSEADQSYGLLSLGPKTVAVTVDISRHTIFGLAQAGSAYVYGEVMGAADRTKDAAFINGSGADGERWDS